MAFGEMNFNTIGGSVFEFKLNKNYVFKIHNNLWLNIREEV